MKKTFLISLFLLPFFACATRQAPPPSVHIGQIPASVVAELSLEERILVEEAWKDLNQGKTERAEKTIARLGYQNPLYHAGLGYVYLLLNNLSRAETAFKAGLEDYPDLVLLHSGLAQIYQKTGQEDQAFIEYREILKTEPENPWAKIQYEALRSKKIDESLIQARSYLAEGDTKKGKEFLLKTLFYSPQHIEANMTLANIYKKENKLQNALVHLKAASSVEPENKTILKDYAETLYKAGQYTKSLSVYEQLSNLEPENKGISDRIGDIRSKLGVLELPSTYDSIPLSQAVNKEEIAALLAVKFREVLDEVSTKPPIIIDIATSWAQRFILQMTALGVLDIYPNHTFQPKKAITRAEMAEILYRLIGYLQKKGNKFIQQIPPERIQISDVSPQNYYYQPILQILSLNVMELSADRSFQPDLPVSGKQAIRYLDIILVLIK